MTDPATGTATAVATGIAALIMTALGVEPQALVWGLVGATFGMPLAPPSGVVRKVMLFAAVVLACALLGTWAADFWHSGSKVARNSWAMGLGVIFHPALARVIALAPNLVDFAFRSRTGEKP